MRKTSALILAYHNIGIPSKEAALKGLYVTPTMFRFQMWYLSVIGFQVVSLESILRFTRGEIKGRNLVALTFDDGYQDFYENAFPVLHRYGYPATVFIVSDLVGKENRWDYQNIKVKKQLLDWQTIRELQNAGIDFNSHTKTHPFLSRIPLEDMEREVTLSKTEIEERLKRPVNFFCYPYGDYNDRTLLTVKRAGYLGALTLNRGSIHERDNPFELRRSFIRYSTNPFLFMRRCHGCYEDRKGGRL